MKNIDFTDFFNVFLSGATIKDVLLLNEFTFQLRECACGEGTLPLEKYAQLATAENPDMPMIIEHLHSDEEYLQSLSYLQKRLKTDSCC